MLSGATLAVTCIAVILLSLAECECSNQTSRPALIAAVSVEDFSISAAVRDAKLSDDASYARVRADRHHHHHRW